MENMVSRTLSVHQEHEMLLKLETAGLTDELAQRIIDSKGNDLAMKVVRLISNGGFEATTSQKRAREIMGRNYFGIEEAIRHFRVNPSRQQLAALAEVPFTEATLEELRHGTRIKLRAAPAARARELLEALEGIGEIQSMNGEVLMIEADPARTAEINQHLVTAGIEVSELCTVKLSLESVFLSLTGEAIPHE